MDVMRLRYMKSILVLAAATLVAGCETTRFGQSAAPEPAQAPEIPATIAATEVVGRWGFAAYQRVEDRARTETAARGQCRNPYVIGAGPTGGVIMHLADETQPQELKLKGGPGGKNYIGPPGPGGDEKDREIMSFDGRVMIMRFIDKDAATRYGTSVYVRCAPTAASR
jgi:hypothetical protein